MMASRGTLGTRCEAARRIAIGDSGLAGESLLPRLVDLARCSSIGEDSRDPTADKETGDIDSMLHDALRGTPINRCLLNVGDEVTGLLFLRGESISLAFVGELDPSESPPCDVPSDSSISFELSKDLRPADSSPSAEADRRAETGVRAPC